MARSLGRVVAEDFTKFGGRHGALLSDFWTVSGNPAFVAVGCSGSFAKPRCAAVCPGRFPDQSPIPETKQIANKIAACLNVPLETHENQSPSSSKNWTSLRQCSGRNQESSTKSQPLVLAVPKLMAQSSKPKTKS